MYNNNNALRIQKSVQSPYKAVWRTLNNSGYKKLKDSLMKLLTLYHV